MFSFPDILGFEAGGVLLETRFLRLLDSRMTYILVTRDPEVREAFLSPEAFLPSDTLKTFESWQDALKETAGADMMFVQLVATLDEPHKIGGYERFAEAKMADEALSAVPLVLIAPPADYELDFMVGYPDFVFAQVPHPVTTKIFRRASTWI